MKAITIVLLIAALTLCSCEKEQVPDGWSKETAIKTEILKTAGETKAPDGDGLPTKVEGSEVVLSTTVETGWELKTFGVNQCIEAPAGYGYLFAFGGRTDGGKIRVLCIRERFEHERGGMDSYVLHFSPEKGTNVALSFTHHLVVESATDQVLVLRRKAK